MAKEGQKRRNKLHSMGQPGQHHVHRTATGAAAWTCLGDGLPSGSQRPVADRDNHCARPYSAGFCYSVLIPMYFSLLGLIQGGGRTF